MKMSEIREQPTSIKGNFPNGIHQSCFRAYHVLQKVKDILEMEKRTCLKVESALLLELIEDMEDAPDVEKSP